MLGIARMWLIQISRVKTCNVWTGAYCGQCQGWESIGNDPTVPLPSSSTSNGNAHRKPYSKSTVFRSELTPQF